MSQVEPMTCTLHFAAEGRVEPCPRARCPFWEPGGAVLEGNCLIDRLGVDLQHAALATYLLETRECLERARERGAAERAHREFARRIGLEL